MFKDPFDARLIFLSELNMRFDVTACAGAASTNIRIQFTSDRFLLPPPLLARCNNSCSVLMLRGDGWKEEIASRNERGTFLFLVGFVFIHARKIPVDFISHHSFSRRREIPFAIFH